MPVTPEVARMRKTINIARHSFANILAPIALTLVCVAGLNAAAAFAQGIITTVAGNGTRGVPGDGVEFAGGAGVDSGWGGVHVAVHGAMDAGDAAYDRGGDADDPILGRHWRPGSENAQLPLPSSNYRLVVTA